MEWFKLQYNYKFACHYWQISPFDICVLDSLLFIFSTLKYPLLNL